jgi:hypothetical protein
VHPRKPEHGAWFLRDSRLLDSPSNMENNQAVNGLSVFRALGFSVFIIYPVRNISIAAAEGVQCLRTTTRKAATAYTVG